MSDMLKVFVRQEVDEHIKSMYTHLLAPAHILAKVIHIQPNGQCTIRILDKNLQVDYKIPDIPGVSVVTSIKQDDIVVVALLYGEFMPYIVGRYQDANG